MSREAPRSSRMATVSIALAIVNLCASGILLSYDSRLTAISLTLLGVLGAYTGRKARRRIKRTHGVMQGESQAIIGYYAGLFAAIIGVVLLALTAITVMRETLA